MKNLHKHVLLSFLVFFAFNFYSVAQGNSKSDLQIGIGFLPNYEINDFDFFSDDIENFSENIPHITLSWDQEVLEEIGPGMIMTGGFLAYSQWQFEGDLSTINYHFISGGLRGSYTLFPVAGFLEPYAGVQILYHYLYLSDEQGNGAIAGFDLSSEGALNFSVLAGSRLMIAESFGLFAEIDPLFVTFKTGLVFKRF